MKNLIGAFMILVLSGSANWLLLVPELQKAFTTATLTQNLQEWIGVGGGLLLVIFLFAYPIFLIIQGIVDFRTPRTFTV